MREQIEEILAVEGLQYVQLAAPLVDEGAVVFGEVEAARVGHQCCAGCDGAASHGGNVTGAADIAEGFVFDTVLALGTFFEACRHAGGVGPGGEQLIEQRLLPGACPGGLELGKQAGNIAGLSGGLLQFAHVTGTAHVGKNLEGFRHFDLLGEFRIESVGSKFEFAHRRRAAVGARKAAFTGKHVAVTEALVLESIGEVERNNACFSQGDEFAALGNAILRHITPEFQLCESGIGSIEDTVAVGVE
ncbi:hypothetical protein [Nitrosomonas europaea]|uniref:hypothetical protein n=1 Tax=Nitrosomonas europaea TaxID=915 RepID=UPI0023F3B1E5|nr:hypothetical protein [Nitrosomonas europaea]